MREAFTYSFEGLDGAGKTTNVRRLHEHYRQKGYKVVALSTPSNRELGIYIRNNMAKLGSEEKIKLFIQDIWDTVLNCPPGLDIAFWDRYTDSVYSSNRGLTLKQARELIKGLPTSHLTFLLDIPVEVAWEREREISTHPLDLNWLKIKHDRYEELVVLEPERFRRIDATQSPSLVLASIATSIDSHIGENVFNGFNPLFHNS